MLSMLEEDHKDILRPTGYQNICYFSNVGMIPCQKSQNLNQTKNQNFCISEATLKGKWENKLDTQDVVSSYKGISRIRRGHGQIRERRAKKAFIH